MSLRDKYDFDTLVNQSEREVLAELEVQLARTPGLCTCQECVLDMAAYALNKVRPAYRVSLMGSVYASAGARGQHAREIAEAVREAIQKVKSNPSHD
ncbi:MAG: late competence development ComFB family protein [Spirochaetia bacterium]|jgi:competence protein ComFB